MKQLFGTGLIFLGLTACGPSQPKLTLHQAAVEAYLKKNLDDPSTYQPVSWGPEKIVRVSDEAKDKLATAQAIYQNSPLVKVDSARYQSELRMAGYLHTKKDVLEMYRQRYLVAARGRDSVRQVIQKLQPATKDTARLSYLLIHSFRAKNKLGALVLDSAIFEVNTNNQVSVRGRGAL